MKTKLQIAGITLIGIILTACSSSMHMSSSVTPTDDIYYTPSKVTTIASNNTQLLSTNQNEPTTETSKYLSLEKKYSKTNTTDTVIVKSDTLVAKVDSLNPYRRILSDSYQESYERRLRGMEDPHYGMENWSIYYSDDYWYAQAYDPSLYHIIIMGDQVWVEPWYISTMFSWPRNTFSGLGWNFYWGWGFYSPWYSDYPYSYWNGDFYTWNPFWYGGSIYNNYYDDYYYGRRTGGISNYTTKRDGLSYEDQIISSRRRGGTTYGTNPIVSTRTRSNNTMQTFNKTTTQQEVTQRGNRNLDLNTTRLRGGNSNNYRSGNIIEPTRRNGNNMYQKPTRNTSNDNYNRLNTRNYNNNNASRDNTRNSNITRDNGRNNTPTYNRPNRVESSSSRERSTSTERFNGGSSFSRNSGNSDFSSRSSSSSSSSSSQQNNSSSGSHNRGR